MKAAPARAASSTTDGSAKPERISKILARAGVASRRDIERMIMEGRVRLNGQVLETPVVNATLEDRIEVDGHPIRGIERTRLWLYHKPSGLVTTNSDPEGRATVFDNLPEGLPRVLSIGRLDINTEGLLLLTNDGGLSRVLELPTTGWLRRYRVRAYGEIEQGDLDKLKDGIAVDGVLYGAIEATLDRQQGHNVWITMGLREGKNREIKNVMGALGLEVNRLIRISYGPFQLGDLPEGQVVEVRGRTLRDQLGPRLIEDSKANFDAPIYNETGGEEASDDHADKPEKREKGGWSKEARPQEARSRDVRPDARRPDTRRPDARGEEPRRDKAPGRPDARRDDRGFAGKPARGGARDERSFDEEKPKKRPPMGTTRTANVWMAPGARPTTDAKGKRTSARADAERLFDKPKPQNDRPIVVNRVPEDKDWIRGEDAPAREEGGKRSFGDRPDRGGDRPRGDRPQGDRARGDRPQGDRPRGDRPQGDRPTGGRPAGGRPRSGAPGGDRGFGDRPRGDRKPREEGDRPRAKSFSGDARSERPRSDRPFGDRPPRAERPFSDKPRGDRGAARPDGDRPRSPRPRSDAPRSDGPRSDRPRSDRPRSEGAPSDRPRSDRPRSDAPRTDRPRGDRPAGDRPFGDKPRGKPFGGKPGGGKSFGGKPAGGKPTGNRGNPSGGGGGKPGGRPPGGRPSGGKPRTPRG